MLASWPPGHHKSQITQTGHCLGIKISVRSQPVSCFIENHQTSPLFYCDGHTASLSYLHQDLRIIFIQQTGGEVSGLMLRCWTLQHCRAAVWGITYFNSAVVQTYKWVLILKLCGGATARNLQLFKTKINNTFRAGLQLHHWSSTEEKIGFRYSFY